MGRNLRKTNQPEIRRFLVTRNVEYLVDLTTKTKTSCELGSPPMRRVHSVIMVG